MTRTNGAKTAAVAAAIGLVGCTNALDASRDQQEQAVRLQCDCSYDAFGYGTRMECVREELADIDTVDDCQREAYDQVRELHAPFECLLDVNDDFLDCVARARCDEAATERCDEERTTAADACPEAPDSAYERANDIVEECEMSRPPEPLPSGACPDGSLSGSGLLTSDTTVGAGAELSGTCGGDGAPELAFEWTAPTAGTWVFDTVGSDYDTVLYARSGCAGAELACDDDTDGLQSEITVDLAAGQTIVLVVDGFGGSDGAFVLNATLL
ncbi:MAG TPA: hypothetical protein RMH99_05935 [Sandaracinaceae bacterium LLY-WYZ-13_1]|nr:hypothetical protein [Sandaracinaceae bacterium LLY-WYZ-13_1]